MFTPTTIDWISSTREWNGLEAPLPIQVRYPSVTFQDILVPPPASNEEWRFSLPSIWTGRGRKFGIIRRLNYVIRDGLFCSLSSDGIFRTQNYAFELNSSYIPVAWHKVEDHSNSPTYPSWVLGYEDCRLFRCRGQFWGSATSNFLHPGGICKETLLSFDDNFDIKKAHLLDVRPDCHQKNWLPGVWGDDPFFIYNTNPLVVLRLNPHNGLVSQLIGDNQLAPTGPRGSTPVLDLGPFWLYLVHEVLYLDGYTGRQYIHYFVLLNKDFSNTRIGPSFRFRHKGLEFAGGLTLDEASGRAVVSFTTNECWPQLAFLDIDQILSSMKPI
jgi:hypothetical protein